MPQELPGRIIITSHPIFFFLSFSPIFFTFAPNFVKNILNLEVSSNISEKLLDRWEAFVEAHPHGSVLQSRFLYDLFEATRNFEPVMVYCTENDELVGIVLSVLIREADGIKGLFSSRLVVYGGPLISMEHPERSEIFSLMLRNLIHLTQRKAIFTQLRASFDLSGFDKIFTGSGFHWYPRLNLLINTSDPDQVLSGMSAARMRQVRKSLRNGATVVEPDSLRQIHDFYEILRKLYRERIKKPLPDLSFFEAFYNKVRHDKKGKIFLVLYEEKVIGGILCPFMVNKAMFEWYVCGLDEKYKSRGIYPSVLTTWAAIDFAVGNNIRIFDFMGLGKPDIKYGVRDFKLKFGGQVVNYGRYIRINRPVLYWISELGYNLLALFKKI